MIAGDERPLPDLPPEVAERVLVELPGRGEKVLASLRTAAVLIAQAVSDNRGLRFAESAAYNVRETLDAVVSGRSPVEGGLPAVLDAWSRYESELVQPGNDEAASLEALQDVLRRVAEKRDRSSYHASQLLGYLRVKSGVDPLPGDLDPVKEYGQLRREASGSLHSETALDAVTALYDRTVAWFIRMFTPPDALVHAIRTLAAEAWRGSEQVTRLGELVSNQHHLRLFLGRLVDPAWLFPLHEAEIVKLPEPGVPWPVASLVEGLGRRAPTEVAALLERLLDDAKRLCPEQRLDARFELLRVATQLGAAGHSVVAGVVNAHPEDRAVRALGTGAVKRADPTDLLVEQVARAVLRGEPHDHDRHYYELMLERLEVGLNADNVAGRVRLVAAKVREVAKHAELDGEALDIARLTADLGEDDRDYLVVVTHYLARLVVHARRLDVSSAQLLDWTKNIPGEIGERVTCRILAGADDVPIHDKIDHITRRLASSTATGDDKDLIDDVLANDPGPASLTAWTEALGSPSPASADTPLPRDWARVGRWSMVLPEHLLIPWQEPIAQVTAYLGAPSPTALDQRTSWSTMLTGQPAHSTDELAALPVLEAARLVARWRPDAEGEWRLVSARELARTLQTVVEAKPERWSTDPRAVVTALREPVYVPHYFDALSNKATEVAPQTPAIIAAAKLVRTERWTPTVLGTDDFDFEPDWQRVDTATVDLVAALANHDAPLAEDLDTAWTWTLTLLDHALNTNDQSLNGRDALNRAINKHTGRSLQAVLALAGWEYRHTTSIRPQFAEILDNVVRISGSVGMEFRAILAARRVFLETVARDWLDRNTTILFRDNELGHETFDLTLKYARPATPWFYSNLRDDLYAAARRNTKYAIGCLLVGMLRHEPGYEPDAIIKALRGNTAALATAAGEITFIVRNSSTDTPEQAAAVEFWRTLLDANRDIVPAKALRSAGRWALVAGLADTTWSELTIRTLERTDGIIDFALEVAERCQTTSLPASTKTLLLLLGKGEPWEQDHIARTATEALRNVNTDTDENFHPLRTRLIELGYDEAADIAPG